MRKRILKRKRNPELTEEQEDIIDAVKSLIERHIQYNKDSKYTNPLEEIFLKELLKITKNSSPEDLEDYLSDIESLINRILRKLRG